MDSPSTTDVFSPTQYHNDIELAQSSVTLPISKAFGYSVIVKNLNVEYKLNPHFYDCLMGTRRTSKSTIHAVIQCSFVAYPGRVLAVVGADGSGRTSLMNAIAGRIPTTSGIVMATPNQKNISTNHSQKRRCNNSTPASFSFVNGSDEHLLPNLTVYETLMTTASLKTPSLSKQERKEKVDFVLDRMNLKSCRNVYVGGVEWKGISTGERRRVAIAMELLDSSNSIILLDKPTTGIDSAQARQIAELLREIARTENKTIILSLSQPTSGVFDAVDDVLLLHRGRTIYCGETDHVVEYLETSLGIQMFEGSCKADFVVDGVRENDTSTMKQSYNNELGNDSEDVPNKSTLVDEWNLIFKNSLYGQLINTQIEDGLSSEYHSLTSKNSNKSKTMFASFIHFWASVFILCKRFLVNTSRTPLCWLPILLAIIQGLLMGGIMFQYAVQLPKPHNGEVEKLFPENSLSNNLIGNIFIEGFGKDKSGAPRRPLMDLLIHGVDGNGSKPLYDIATYDHHKYVYKGRKALRCLHDKWIKPNNLYYPPNHWPQNKSNRKSISSNEHQEMIMPESIRRLSTQWSHLRSDVIDSIGSTETKFLIDKTDSFITSALTKKVEEGQTMSSIQGPFEAHAVISDMIVALQLVDHIWNGRNYTKYRKECKQNHLVAAELQFYICLFELAGQFIIDGTKCFDMPPFPVIPVITPGIPPLVDDYWYLPKRNPNRRILSDQLIFEDDLNHLVLPLLNAFDSNSVAYPKDQYDEDIFAWNPDISRNEWDKIYKVIQGLIPDMTIIETMKLILSPKTRGDLRKLPDIQKLDDLMKFIKQMIDWMNMKVPNVTTASFHLTKLGRLLQATGATPPPKENRFCVSDFCRNVRKKIPIIKRYATRMVNRVKIILVQREFPRIALSLWTSLTTTGCLFATVATLGFFCFDSLLSFHKDRPMFNREVANGTYHPLAFFLGKNFADIPFQLIPALIITAIWGSMAGVAPTASQFGIYLSISVLVCFAAYGFCYMVSAATPRMEVAIVIAPIILISWLILAGFILRSDNLIPVWMLWYRHISLHRFGWFALMSNTFRDGAYFGSVPNKIILWLMGINDTNIGKMCLILAALGLGFRLMGFVCLRFFYRKVGLLQH